MYVWRFIKILSFYSQILKKRRSTEDITETTECFTATKISKKTHFSTKNQVK